jgi:hypothetical protein
MELKYDIIRNDFVRRMNVLLARAQKGDAGVMDDFRLIQADFDARVVEGFVDWENDISIHLKMLKYWCEQAEPTPP